MTQSYICDAIRTPIGRYGGSLSSIRTDDLAALPISELIRRNPQVDWDDVDDIILGCANQAGEDNRNVARMAGLIAGLPVSVPGATINRLCGSGLDAVGMAARGIRADDYNLVIAGGVESMSRAPFVVPKAQTAFSRSNEIYDTTIGWRFINPVLRERYGVDSMPETADNVAEQFGISREDQDAFAERSQQRCEMATVSGIFADEIMIVTIPQKRGNSLVVRNDEHPRSGITVEKLGKLGGINGPDLSVTAGNASGVNDGAAAVLIASDSALIKHDLAPRVRVVAMAAAGVEPRIMGIGPVPAIHKVLARAKLRLDQMDIIELNEAFAAQALAVLRELGIPDDAEHVNPNGGAIALGHPLGMSGSRLAITATNHLHRSNGKYALIAMCVGVGQGVAMILERV